MHLVLYFIPLILIALPSLGMREDYIPIEPAKLELPSDEQFELIQCLAKSFFENQLKAASVNLAETRACFEEALSAQPEVLANSIAILKHNYSYQNFINNWLNKNKLAEYIEKHGVLDWEISHQNLITSNKNLHSRVFWPVDFFLEPVLLICGIAIVIPSRIGGDNAKILPGSILITQAILYYAFRIAANIYGQGQRSTRLDWLKDVNLELTGYIHKIALDLAEANIQEIEAKLSIN